MMLWFGVLGITESIVGTILSFLTLSYFISRKNLSVSTILYIGFNTSDLLVCLMVMAVGVSSLRHDTNPQGWFASEIYCTLWGIAWSISIRMSVYILGIISISRTLSHTRPLHPINKGVIVNLLVWYLVLLTAQSFLPFLYNKGYYYNETSIMCVWQLAQVFDVTSASFKTVYFVTVVLQFILPALPIVTSCFISVIILQRQVSDHLDMQSHIRKRRATVTVILLTLAYAIFYFPLCVVLSQHSLSLFCNFCFKTVSSNHILEQFFSTHFFALNAITNAIIYFSRIKDMRLFILKWKNEVIHVISFIREKLLFSLATLHLETV